MKKRVFCCVATLPLVWFPTQALSGEPRPDENETAILKEDLRKFEGQWETTYKTQDRTIRSVQVIRGKKSTVTRFDENGAVSDAHTAEFVLTISGRIKVFTYFNLEVTAGPLKGSRFLERRSFVYRLEDDWFLEAYGLLIDQREHPSILTWRRNR